MSLIAFLLILILLLLVSPFIYNPVCLLLLCRCVQLFLLLLLYLFCVYLCIYFSLSYAIAFHHPYISSHLMTVNLISSHRDSAPESKTTAPLHNIHTIHYTCSHTHTQHTHTAHAYSTHTQHAYNTHTAYSRLLNSNNHGTAHT